MPQRTTRDAQFTINAGVTHPVPSRFNLRRNFVDDITSYGNARLPPSYAQSKGGQPAIGINWKTFRNAGADYEFTMTFPASHSSTPVEE